MPMPVITLQNLMQSNDSIFNGIALPVGADEDLMVYAILFNYGEMPVLYPDWSVFRFTTQNWFAAHLSQLQHLYNDWEASYNPVYNKDGYLEEVRTPNLYKSISTGGTESNAVQRIRNADTARNADSTETPNTMVTETPNTTITETPTTTLTESGSTTEQYKGFNSTAFADVSKELPGKVTTAGGMNTTATTGTNTTTRTGTDSRNEQSTEKLKDDEQVTGTINRSGNETQNESGTETTTRHEYGNIGITMASQMLRDDVKFWELFAFYDVAAKLFAVDNLIMVY